MPTAQLSVYFFLQAAVILATCRLVGALGRRFGQPQVVGACLDQLRHAALVLVREAKAVTDNPLIIADKDLAISFG